MNSRERVFRCFDHQKADRVPLAGSFRPEVWEQLKEHFGTDNTSAISEMLGMDFKGVGMGASSEYREKAVSAKWGTGIPQDDGSLESEWGVRITGGSDDRYMKYVYCPLADESNLQSYQFPDLDQPERWEGLEERVKKLKENYPVASGVSTFFRNAWDLCGLENWLAHLSSPGPFVTELLDRMLEFKLEQTRRVSQAGIDTFNIGGDIAMHTRLFMKPDVWREHFKWRDAVLVEEAKKHGVKNFFFHTDGNLMEVMEDLIEIGFTIFDPIQPECMDPYEVKERWGDRITMQGTISSQHTLPFGTVEDVRNEVRERIERCGQNGGLVIAPNNVVQYDVPLENLLALYETAKEM